MNTQQAMKKSKISTHLPSKKNFQLKKDKENQNNILDSLTIQPISILLKNKQ